MPLATGVCPDGDRALRDDALWGEFGQSCVEFGCRHIEQYAPLFVGVSRHRPEGDELRFSRFIS